MKDFEFITGEEWENLRETFLGLQGKIVSRYAVLNLLNEKAQPGYTSKSTFLNEDIVCSVVTEKRRRGSDTHEAFVFLRPIEEEVECDHKYTLSGYDCGQVTIDVKVKCNFCPLCGKKL